MGWGPKAAGGNRWFRVRRMPFAVLQLKREVGPDRTLMDRINPGWGWLIKARPACQSL